jgi:hypothetical protein
MVDLRAVLSSCLDNVDMVVAIDKDCNHNGDHIIAIYVEHRSSSDVLHSKLVKIIDTPLLDFALLQDIVVGVKEAAADLLGHILSEEPTFKTRKCPHCGKIVYSDRN